MAFNYHDNKSDNRSRGRDNNRSFDRPAMHPATCSKCGKACQVPFIPTGNRPIFCTSCFKEQGGSQGRPQREARISYDDRRSDRPERQMFDAICDNCGNRCQIPFRPSAGKPVYCSHCFEGNQKQAAGKFDSRSPEKPQYKEQFEALNAKLDTILNLLRPVPVEKVAPIEKTVVEQTVPVEEKKKKPSKKKPRVSKKVTEVVTEEPTAEAQILPDPQEA